MAKSEYKTLVGLSYGDKYVEAGQIVTDIPKESVAWLLASGLITADVESATPEIVADDQTQNEIIDDGSEPTASEPLEESE